jgi:hypothetical protein
MAERSHDRLLRQIQPYQISEGNAFTRTTPTKLQNSMNTDDSFWQGILLKLSFKPEKVHRMMAALIYVGLTGRTFTADTVPKVVWQDNTTSGCSVRLLASGKKGLGILDFAGWTTSPAKTRHGAPVKSWRMPADKRKLALTWLERNGFDLPPVGDDAPLFTAAQNGELQPV